MAPNRAGTGGRRRRSPFARPIGCPSCRRPSRGAPTGAPVWPARPRGCAVCQGGPGRTAAAEPLRLLLADDHVAFRDGLRALLGTVEGLEVSGGAGSGGGAVTRAGALPPDA